MENLKIQVKRNNCAEKCAFVRKSEVKEYLKRQRKIEERFKVKFSPINLSALSTSCESDIVAVGVCGSPEDVNLASNYLDMLSACSCSKTMVYPLHLHRVVADNTWMQVLEMAHNVIVRSGQGTTVTIGGKTMTDINGAVLAMEKLINCSKLPPSQSKENAVNSSIEKLLQSDIPSAVKVNLNASRSFPAPVLEVLISWVRKAYGVVQNNADDSVVILEDSFLCNSSSSANYSGDQNEKDLDDSVIVLDSPVPEKEVSVIIISDEEDPPESSSDIQGLKNNKRKKMRKADGTAKSVGAPGEDSTEVAKLPLFISLKGKKRKVHQLPTASSSAPPVPRSLSQPRVLRPIVIDGSNVAMDHGKTRKVFSCRGILLAVEYFKNRGHTNVVAFVPQFRRRKSSRDTIDQQILEELSEKGLVAFVPSRNVNGKCITSYDDRFIVRLAHTNGGVIVSNDNYRDLINENAEWKETIQHRLNFPDLNFPMSLRVSPLKPSRAKSGTHTVGWPPPDLVHVPHTQKSSRYPSDLRHEGRDEIDDSPLIKKNKSSEV